MAFVLKKSATYFWPVKLEVPIDGGKFEVVQFDAEFKSIPQSRLLDLIAKQERGRATDVDVVKEILVGWKGIVDDQENEIPFSIKARDQLLDVVGVASVLGEIFFESRARAKRKN